MRKWEVVYSRGRSHPMQLSAQENDNGGFDVADVETQIRQWTRCKLQFEYFTDQIDVWSVRNDGRRDRFMTLYPSV